jgi:hypothetical protein
VGYRAGQKNLAESEFGEFISVKKQSKLLLIKHIQQSPKFDKPSYRDYQRGMYHSTVDLLFDWFGLVCFANKNQKLSVVIQLFPNQSNRRSTVQ